MEGGRKEEKHQCVAALHTHPTGDLACNPGMCPDWESTQKSFGSQVGAQSTKPHQPGLKLIFLRLQLLFFYGYFLILIRKQNAGLK